MTREDRLKELAAEYGLTKEDFHVESRGGKKIVTMKRCGIEKIAVQRGLNIDLNIEYIDLEKSACCVKATVQFNGVTYQSYGESTKTNTKAPYPVAMAEKRAVGRVVLKATEFSHLDIHSEDEADEETRKDYNPNFNDMPL